MSNPTPRRAPTFLWQGVLIVLPVLILASVGLLSLRQDRALAESEAKERAKVIADQLAERIWTKIATPLGSSAIPDPPIIVPLTNTSPWARIPFAQFAYPPSAERPRTSLHHGDQTFVVFKISPRGELLFPPPIPSVPAARPLDSTKLDEEQRHLWQAARASEFVESDSPSAIDGYTKLLATNPPEDFAAASSFALGLLLQSKQPQLAADALARVVSSYSNAVSESGLPLTALAALKLAQLAVDDASLLVKLEPLEDLCREAVFHPSVVSSRVLGQTYAAQRMHRLHSDWTGFWIGIWSDHEQSRRLFLAASQQLNWNADVSSALPLHTTAVSAGSKMIAAPRLALPKLFWVNDTQDWLGMVASRNPSDLWLVCRPEKDVRATVAEELRLDRNVPEYFGISVELAGRKVTDDAQLRVWNYTQYFSRNGGGMKKEYVNNIQPALLTSASKIEDASEPLKVNLYLTSPAALYRQQHSRVFWFGSLIAVSAAAALIGLFAAWRAFHRQQQLNEMKSNFVSSVSHELRAPIASVRLMAESLDRGTIRDDTRRAEYFRLIVQECRRLTSLIENVLDFSRIEQGRKQYEFEPTDVVALVQQTVKLMEPYAAERQVKLNLAIDHQPSTINHFPSPIEQPSLNDPQLSTFNPQPTIDGRALQQALVNLLDNAIKHSPPEKTVTVGLDVAGRLVQPPRETPTDDPQRSLESLADIGAPGPGVLQLWVEDQGDGIPPEEHEKIFEPFYRRGLELRRDTQGVGIGLTIVKHIVAAHGGRVMVRSELGKGSRFTIELTAINHQDTNSQRKDR